MSSKLTFPNPELNDQVFIAVDIYDGDGSDMPCGRIAHRGDIVIIRGVIPERNRYWVSHPTILDRSFYVERSEIYVNDPCLTHNDKVKYLKSRGLKTLDDRLSL